MIYGRELERYPFNTKAFLTRCLIVAQRKVFGHWLSRCSPFAKPKHDWSEVQANGEIANAILSGKPCMVARFGSNELEAALRGLAISDRKDGTGGRLLDLMFGKCAPFWWDNGYVSQNFYNEHWVRPMSSEVPENSQTIEGGCYW